MDTYNDDYYKKKGQEIAIMLLDQYFQDKYRSDLVLEVHHEENVDDYYKEKWCNYYNKFWELHTGVYETICLSYRDYHVFVTHIKKG